MFKQMIKKIPVAMVLVGSVLTMRAEAAELPDIVRMIVPASPGAGTDLLARALSAELSAKTGKTFIVENRPGASTMIGSAHVAKGPADGSVLLINSTSLMSSGASMKNPPLDVQKDLVPLALLVKNPLVVTASLQSGISTPADLVRVARSKELTHGSAGVGSIAHYTQEFLGDAIGGTFSHVPYKGASAAVTDMSGGIIDTVIGAWSTVAPSVQAGRARAIAVTSAEKNPAFPNLPTIASVAPGFDMDLWIGVFAPAGMSAELVQYLNQEINAVSDSPKLRQFYAADGGEPISKSPEEIAQQLQSDYEKFKRLAVSKNITIN